MKAETMNSLREIGALLDQKQLLRVHDGGIVMPDETAGSKSTKGKEKSYVSRRQRRSATRSRQRAAGRQGQTHRPRPPRRSGDPDVRTSLQKRYEAEIDAVLEAYPGTQKWHQTDGMWLRTDSAILYGLGKKATFLTALPYTPTLTIKSWGFWTTAISTEWIGPRHTNFPEGTICAFEPKDETWGVEDGIVKLLDLYSVWACRHLHLEASGRWPGRQVVHHPYERLSELRADEFCGCDNSDMLYGNCCQKRDLARDQYADRLDFVSNFPNGGARKPPEEILKVIRSREEPPPILSLFS